MSRFSVFEKKRSMCVAERIGKLHLAKRRIADVVVVASNIVSSNCECGSAFTWLRWRNVCGACGVSRCSACHGSQSPQCRSCEWLLQLEQRMLARARAKKNMEATVIEPYEKARILAKSLLESLANASTQLDCLRDAREDRADLHAETRAAHKMVKVRLASFREFSKALVEEGTRNKNCAWNLMIGRALQSWQDDINESLSTFQKSFDSLRKVERALLEKVHEMVFTSCIASIDRTCAGNSLADLFPQMGRDVLYALDMDMTSYSDGPAWVVEKTVRESRVRSEWANAKKVRPTTAARETVVELERLATTIKLNVDPTLAFPNTWNALCAMHSFLSSDDYVAQ